MKPNDTRFSPQQFGIFRILFGCYLLWHFAALIPFAEELFGPTGLLGERHLNPFYGSWPNPLTAINLPWLATSMIGVGCVAALFFTLGLLRRYSALYLCLLNSWLFTANPLTANPSLAYTGLILLLSCLVPLGESFSLSRPRSTQWQMPSMVPLCAWFLMAAGYSFSGYLKLSSPSWLDGSALMHVLENPLARPNALRDLMLALPAGLLAGLTWATLALELLLLPLALSRRCRPWIWLSMALMHLGILMVIDFADLSIGMLMLHLFCYRADWLPASSPDRQPVLFIDGDCGFCQSSVRFLHALDRHLVLHFAPLQGATAGSLPKAWRLHGNARDEAAVLREVDGSGCVRYWRGCDAILRALYHLGGPARLAWGLHLLPERLKSLLYRVVAQQRHKLPRLGSCCPIPTAELRSRLLP